MINNQTTKFKIGDEEFIFTTLHIKGIILLAFINNLVFFTKITNFDLTYRNHF